MTNGFLTTWGASGPCLLSFMASAPTLLGILPADSNGGISACYILLPDPVTSQPTYATKPPRPSCVQILLF